MSESGYPAVNMALTRLYVGRDDETRRRRRTIAVDTVIVATAGVALAHLVVAPDRYAWWPASGVLFAVLGVVQLVYAALLRRGRADQRLLLAGIWGTVAVILLYVATRTIGLSLTPSVPFLGGRWLPGRSIVTVGARYVGPLDMFIHVAEMLLVVTLLIVLPSRSKLRTANLLMWVGLALWGTGIVGLLR